MNEINYIFQFSMHGQKTNFQNHTFRNGDFWYGTSIMCIKNPVKAIKISQFLYFKKGNGFEAKCVFLLLDMFRTPKT